MANLSVRLKEQAASFSSPSARCLISLAFLFVTVFLVPIPCCAQELRSKPSAGYYPLAIGNSWTYSVNGKSKVHQVVWKVLNAKADASGLVFAVWPIPLETDDSGMQLQFSAERLRELSGDFFVLRFPLTTGKTWSVNRSGPDRVFVVLGEGKPCAVGKPKFNACAVVRDDDPAAKLRTVTTYALGVGPVQYEYFNLSSNESAMKATQVVKIFRYSVTPCNDLPYPRSLPA